MVEKELSTGQRNQVVQFILESCIDGKPPRGKLLEAQQKFGIARNTVSRLWGAAKVKKQKGEVIHVISGKKNRKKPKVVHLDLTLLSSLEYSKISTIRKMAVGLGISKSTVGRWVSSGLIKAHISSIKPDLTAPNKLLRMKFSLEALELDMILKRIKFKNMYDTVHIDEKWYYITKGSHRPLFAANGEVLFDEKIGIFPFTTQVPAIRNSKNRMTGTLETKPIESITKQVIKECLINKIIPAIMSKWPERASKDINIQQDNARPHISDNDVDFRAAASQHGFNIKLVQQPPNSPDCNVNDLGWFRAIQSLQIEHACKSVDELIIAVVDSFSMLSPITLDNVFLNLQRCMKGKRSELLQDSTHGKMSIEEIRPTST